MAEIDQNYDEVEEENCPVKIPEDSSNKNLEDSYICGRTNTNENDETEELRKWAIKCNVNHATLDKLLLILRKRLLPDLPKSSKTFLHTKNKIRKILSEKEEVTGEFVYFGIEEGLRRNKVLLVLISIKIKNPNYNLILMAYHYIIQERNSFGLFYVKFFQKWTFINLLLLQYIVETLNLQM